jgi:hypothetical protein
VIFNPFSNSPPSSQEEHVQQPSDPTPSNDRSGERENGTMRAFLWIGVGIGAVGLGAAVAYAVVQALAHARRAPDDPTSQRIQQLIDEANSLLKTLDEQRNSA